MILTVKILLNFIILYHIFVWDGININWDCISSGWRHHFILCLEKGPQLVQNLVSLHYSYPICGFHYLCKYQQSKNLSGKTLQMPQVQLLFYRITRILPKLCNWWRKGKIADCECRYDIRQATLLRKQTAIYMKFNMI